MTGRFSVMKTPTAIPLVLACCLLGPGCREPAPPEMPEQTVARIFALAQSLEKEGKTKQAFAAYHQLVRLFPSTAEGKQAAERLRQAQHARRPKAK
jgi:hypothetical protein